MTAEGAKAARLASQEERDPATILTLNVGSSSLKFALFRRDDATDVRIASGVVDGVGKEQGRLRVRIEGVDKAERTARFEDHEAAIRVVLEILGAAPFEGPAAVGHRIVHGGAEHQRHAAIDPNMLTSLRRAVPFAPLHLPAEIRGIETAMKVFPDAVQVACFDTTFHRELPEISRRFPLPRSFYDEGIKRYGFHGLSYEYVVENLGRDVGRRTIVAHLGNGSSMVALADGKPIETTMGLTPTGGFMSATRTGDLDPGVFLQLMRKGHTPDQLERIVNQESGLLGVSGESSDMRTIEARRQNHDASALAFDMFCYQARQSIGALATVLGGIDTLVFTGGIGEGSAAVRAQICSGLDFLGIRIDEAKNRATSGAARAEAIHAGDAACQVRVVATDEESVIARHTRHILGR